MPTNISSIKKKPDSPMTLSADNLEILSAIVGRAQLAASLGYSFSGDRDIYKALGYDILLTWALFCSRYERQGFARAVIDRPVVATWGRGFALMESSDDNDTQLEKAWRDLEKRLQFTSRFTRLDRLSGIGSYGVLLLGTSDINSPGDFAKPLAGKGLKLNYVRPFGGMSNDGDAQIQTWVTDPSDPRYGQPMIYSVTVQNLSTGDSHILQVHHTRVIHVADGLGSSEVEGTPRLQPVWNNLMNLEKIVGGSAEMYWRGARPGYFFSGKDGVSITQQFLDGLQTQFDEYEHNQRRILAASDLDVKDLGQQVADPTAAVNVQMEEIAAITGIPKRVFTGSERGELASSQDRNNHADYVEDRQLNFAEAKIIRPTIDRLIELAILPPATEEGYSIQWPDQRAPSDLDRAKVGETRANALAKYAGAPGAEAVVPQQAFLREFLGLDEDQVKLIEEEKTAGMAQEANAPEMQSGNQLPGPPA